MVRKITPTAGGWGKRAGALDNQHRAFEQSAVRHLNALSLNAAAWRDNAIRTLGAPLTRAGLPATLVAAFHTAIVELVNLEIPTLPAAMAGPRKPIDDVAYRSRLRGLLTFLDHADELLDVWTIAIANILRRLAAAAPNMPADALLLNLNVPFVDLLPASVDLVADIVTNVLRFAPTDPAAVVPGAVLAQRVKDNLLSASRITEETAAKNPYRLTSPKQSGLTGEALLAAYLADTPFHALLTAPVPFAIPRKKFASHTFVAAPPNHGKTQLGGAVVYAFLQEPDPPAMIIADPHGDFFKKLLALDVFHPQHGRLRDRLLVLDPDDPHGPPPLNFLDFGTTTETGAEQTFSYLLSSLSTEWTPVQATAAGYLLKLLRLIPNASIDTLRLVLDDRSRSADTSRFADAIHALPDFERDYFVNLFFESRMQVTKQAMASKVYQVLGNQTFRTMFSATHNSFDLHQAMQDKRIVLANGASGTLGHDGMAIFLQFIVGQFYAASFKQAVIPEHLRPLCLLIVDEAHYVLSFAQMIKNILTECRKFGYGFFALTQLIEAMSPDVRAAIFGATSNRFAGPVSAGDAHTIAREMYCTADFIRSMQSVERSHCEWAVQIEGVTHKQAIRLTLPFGTLERAPAMTAADINRVRARNHARLADTTPQPTANKAAANTGTARPLAPPATTVETRQSRDIGKYEDVTLQGITLSALMDTDAPASLLVVAHCRRTGTADTPRLSFTIASRGATHSFDRPITGTRTITGIDGATAEYPTVPLFVTLNGHRALEQFAVTVDPEPQAHPVILGQSFLTTARFSLRMSSTENIRADHGRQRPGD